MWWCLLKSCTAQSRKINLINQTNSMSRDRPDGLIPAHAFFLSIANRSTEKASLDFMRHHSDVRNESWSSGKRLPIRSGLIGNRTRFGASSVQLFLVRLRPRRAELCFTGQNYYTKPDFKIATRISQRYLSKHWGNSFRDHSRLVRRKILCQQRSGLQKLKQNHSWILLSIRREHLFLDWWSQSWLSKSTCKCS